MFLTLRRLIQLLGACLRFWLLPMLLPASWRTPPEVRARRFIEHLGGAWTKFGQTLALRFDVLPPEYCNELLKLLNEAKPFAYRLAREVIREDLGRYPEQLFATFDATPFAAASIGQVHRATAHDGTRLAVKVQRPRIAKAFRADYRVMRLFTGFLDLFGAFGGASGRAFVDEFARWADEEIDYRIEARNAYRASQLSQGSETQVDAAVRFEYSSRRVLTTELLDGIPLLDILRAVSSGDQAYLDRIAAEGHSLDRIAHHICWNMLNQLFRDGFFHADLHPANLFVLADDAIGYVDYGIVGRLPKKLQVSLRRYFQNIVEGDFHAAVEEQLTQMVPALTTDMDEVRRELMAVLETQSYGAHGEGVPFQATSAFITSMMEVVRRHNLAMNQHMLLYLKAVLTTDAVVFKLVPDLAVFDDVDKFLAGELEANLSNANRPTVGRLVHEVWAVKYQLNQLVSDLTRIQNTGRAIVVSLDSLRTTAVFYGIWALATGVVAFLLSRTDIFSDLFASIDLNARWVSGLFYAGAALLLIVMWRQGQRVRLMVERRTSPRRDDSDGPTDNAV